MDPDIVSAPLEPGTLLVAGVELSDGMFDGTVVLLLDVDESGALGVVLNVTTTVDIDSVLLGWAALTCPPHRLHDGGPVSPDGAICLAVPEHPTEEPPGWRPLFGRVGLLHLETPLELALGGYRFLRIFAGYAGWAPGQLAAEVDQRMWHPVPALVGDVFDPDPESLWRRVLSRQGGQLGWLSTWTPSPELN
ncbi:MAG: YqgE/AlgH family protein [Propionibacteriaceae bacterium]|nr:YqgE/AlgH family protein [Propionibacteriaceae bacterium]